jgi:hypothetical protein
MHTMPDLKNRFAHLSPLGARKSEPLPYSEEPELPHEPRHVLRNFLFETFTLPLILLGLPAAGEMPAPPPASAVVQLLPSGAQKAAETQRLRDLVKQHLSSSPDPGNPGNPGDVGDPERRQRLFEAIEKISDLHEKLIEQSDAIQAVLDAYVQLERERGTSEEDIHGRHKKIRGWIEHK